MRAKKILAVLAGIVVYFVLTFVLTGYGNKKVHPDLNSEIVEAFTKRHNKGMFAIPKFKNYLFVFDGKKIAGTGVTQDGLFHAEDVTGVGYGYYEEGRMSLSPKEWISHGGYSADVPEVPASLRHFYDPTKPAGSRYLNDLANSKIMGFMQKLFTNPRVDGVEWAVGQPNSAVGVQEHYYTWENGKMWMKQALEEKDAEKRKELLARTWRSLGETLHMVADHGCPSHVRNDAHPSPFFNNNNIFGNPDPYEEYVDYFRNKQSSTFRSFFGGAPDADLKAELSAHKTIRPIAHSLAVFVNRNFVTTETISGTNRYGNPVKQIIHDSIAYKSPLLHNMEYSKDYYTSTVGQYEVKQCTDISYFAGIIPRLVYPYVDAECVKSQAKALIPNIIEAGMQAVQIYIPELSVEIKSAVGGIVKGTIKHKTDSEYKNEIVYQGDLYIEIREPKKFKKKKEYKIEAKDGKFEAKGINFIEGDLAYAEIRLDGFYVKSPEFVCGSSVPFNFVHISLSSTKNFIETGYDPWNYFSLGTYQGKPDVVTFTKTYFKIEKRLDGSEYNAEGTIKDGYVKSLKIWTTTRYYEGSVLEQITNQRIELQNLNVSLSDIDPGEYYGNTFKLKPELGMLSWISSKSEYYYDGKMNVGTEIQSYSQDVFINNGTINITFRTLK